MWARGRFDVGWSELAFAALRCAWAPERAALAARVERRFSPRGDALVCYSVRSAFDLLLGALRLPVGSEVLCSALNVKGMRRVIESHGLVPVPVDLELESLAPHPERLERALSPRSRVLLVAHLFGARLELGPLLALARRRGLFVVEDCAQAFDATGDTGDPGSDAALFSFGPLKTATALGGALARVRDPELLARMRAAQAGDPVQTRREYLWRVVRFAVLALLTSRPACAALHRLARATGADLDRRVEEAARSLTRQRVPGGGRKRRHPLRRAPGAPMLALLERRLARASPDRLEARARAGRALLAGVEGALVCPGAHHARHSFWLFPVLAKEPAALIDALRRAGFDATRVVSLRAIPAPADRPELEPVAAREFLARAVLVPCRPEMGERELAREAALLRSGAPGAAMPPRPGFLGRLRRARRRHVKRFGKRLIRALGGFLGRQSRIGDAAVFDVACLPALRELERHWHEIRDEVDAELRELDELPALRELSRDQSRIAADPSWKAFVFHGFGFRSELNRSRCPRTSRLLDAVPGLENAWLSILGPRYHVPEHRGITKGMLNCLVGLRVPGPPGASRIRIGSEWRAFAEGRAILFDDTVPHEVWNDAPSERVVLLVSVRRPLRWPGRLLNALFLAAFKRTAYVREAVATFRGWEERRRATLGR